MDYVKIGNEEFPTLLAITIDEQEKGLMGAEWPPPVMSFVYASPRVNKYWMKGTKSPLDILFCLRGKVQSIHSGIPYSLSVIGSDDPSDLVIELPAGTCKEKEIVVGDTVQLSCTTASQKRIFFLKNNFRL